MVLRGERRVGARARRGLNVDTNASAFTLYGGTALALRLGHRRSVDFFSRTAFNPGDLAREIPYLASAARVQIVSQSV